MQNLTAKHKKVKYCNKNKSLPSVERLILFVGEDTIHKVLEVDVFIFSSSFFTPNQNDWLG